MISRLKKLFKREITDYDKLVFEKAKQRMRDDALEFSKQIQPIFEHCDFDYFYTDGTAPSNFQIHQNILGLINDMELCIGKDNLFSEVGSGRIVIYYEAYFDDDDEPMYGMKMEIEQDYFGDDCEYIGGKNEE